MVHLANRLITNILLKIKFCMNKINRCSAICLYGSSITSSVATKGDQLQNLLANWMEIKKQNAPYYHKYENVITQHRWNFVFSFFKFL